MLLYVLWRRGIILQKLSVVIAHQVLGGDDRDRHGVSERVQLNRLILLEVLLAEEDVEVGVLLGGDVNLV